MHRSLSLRGRVVPTIARSTVRRLALLLLTGWAACAGGAGAYAQFQCDIFSTSQFNSNPNEVDKIDAAGGGLSDFVGDHGVWLGYSFNPTPTLRITPGYTLGVTLWGTGSSQNMISHTVAASLRQNDFKLFGYRTPAGLSDTAVASDDPAKERMVAMIDRASDFLDSVVYTRRASGTSPASGDTLSAPHAVAGSELGVDDTADIDELDLLGDDDLDDDVDAIDGLDSLLNVPQAHAAPISNDSLLEQLVDRLDGISDSLDIYAGSRELIDRTAAGIREVTATLNGMAASDAAAREAARQLNAVASALASYKAVDEAADADDDLLAETELAEDDIPESAPLSITHQALIRNTADDYYFYTSDADAGADALRISASGGISRYINTSDAGLLQYNNNSINASISLEQRLSEEWSVWGSYGLADAIYPDAAVFNSVEHTFAAQFRYVPSPSLMVAYGLGYGLRSYSQQQEGTSTTDQSQFIAEGTSSTMLTLDAGIFGRPWPNTVVGGVIGLQTTPTLSPRMTIGTNAGQLRLLNAEGSNLADNPFNWHGTAFQLVVMQLLPLDLLASFNVSYEGRNYGRPSVVTQLRTIMLQKERIDKRTDIRLTLARDFDLNESGTSFLSLHITLGSIRNNSTNYVRPNGVEFANSSFKETYAEFGLSWDPF